MKFSLKKSDILSSRIEINKLFESGQSRYIYPFRIFFLYHDETEENESIKVLFSVPKRNFKKAVSRNLIKRRCKEAYRLNRHAMGKNYKLSSLAFVYTEKKTLAYKDLESAMRKIMAIISSL